MASSNGARYNFPLMLVLLFYLDFPNQSEAQLLEQRWPIRITVTTCLYVVIFSWVCDLSKSQLLGPYGQSEAQLLGPLRSMSLAFTLNLPSCHICLNAILSYSLFKAFHTQTYPHSFATGEGAHFKLPAHATLHDLVRPTSVYGVPVPSTTMTTMMMMCFSLFPYDHYVVK